MNRTVDGCDKYVTPDWVMYGFYGIAFVLFGATWKEVRQP